METVEIAEIYRTARLHFAALLPSNIIGLFWRKSTVRFKFNACVSQPQGRGQSTGSLRGGAIVELGIPPSVVASKQQEDYATRETGGVEDDEEG